MTGLPPDAGERCRHLTALNYQILLSFLALRGRWRTAKWCQERTHALGLYNCFCAILCGVNLGDTPQDTPLYHSLPWLYADITAVARLRRPLRKQSNVPVKLRRLALELDDTATADSSATRLSVPEYGAWAFQTLYSGKVYLHGKMAGPTVRDHFPASLAHLSHRLG